MFGVDPASRVGRIRIRLRSGNGCKFQRLWINNELTVHSRGKAVTQATGCHFFLFIAYNFSVSYCLYLSGALVNNTFKSSIIN